MKHLLAATALCLSMAQAQAATLTDTFSSFFVLGDSLSDNGNLGPLVWQAATGGAPFVPRTFTNGEVWNQPLLDDFTGAGKAARNYAFGGARAVDGPVVPGLGTQLGLLASNTTAAIRGDNPLASVWFGANDIFQSFDNPAVTAVAAAQAAADAVLTGARALASLGIDDLILFNLPDLGKTPAYALFQPFRAARATNATAVFNAALAGHVATLRGEGTTVFDFDADAFLNEIRADPGAFGLSETALPCVFPGPLAALIFGEPERCDAATAQTRLFIDSVHPNAAAHAALGARVTAQIEAELMAPIPLPAGLPLLLGGLGGLVLMRRRRAA